MRTSDLPAILAGVAVLAFFLVGASRSLYENAYLAAPLVVTFVKFALLATGGEIVAMRLRTGSYGIRGFGALPKMIVWGILGLAIYAAFAIFAAGVPTLFSPVLAPIGSSRVEPILRAFLISLFMNLIFAPPMMLTHHITDRYIANNGGRFPLGRFRLRPLLDTIDWDRMWGFVYKKTIPFFWIPAHTITFLLPEQFRTAFAAILSVALGLFLGVVGSAKKRV